MKKLLLVLGIGLISLNSYAFEQVIGLSGGYTYTKSDFAHSILSKYDNPAYPNNPMVPKIEKLYANDRSDNGQGYNLNLEYQIKFDAYDISNLFTAGVGYTNENIKVKNKYQDMNNIDYKMNEIYLLGLVKLGQYKDFSLKTGISVGQGFFNVQSYDNYNKVTTNLLIDAEYGIGKSFMIFSRISYLLSGNKEFNYSTNLTFNEAVDHTNNEILSNDIRHKPIEQLVRINLGVRYKI